MNTLSTKHPIALTATSLGTAPYYLNGYIEACIEEKFPVYVDDSLSEASLATLEHAVEVWSTHAAIEIIRGEAALAQSNVETLLDFGTSLTFKEQLPAGFRGNIGFLVQQESQVTPAVEAMVKEGRAFILSSKRWDEHSSEQAHFWKKSFFLPPAWNQQNVQKIKELRAQATGTDTLLVYNTLEWLQSSSREAIVKSIEKTTRCMTLDFAACDSESYISLLSRSNKVILETQNPAELNAWIQLCAELDIPCQPMHGTGSLSPMRKISYGISLKESAKGNESLREELAPTIKLLKEGTTSLDVDVAQLRQSSQGLRAKRIIETLQLWIRSPQSIKAEGAKFLFYTLPQERALHINPSAWSKNGICNEQTWPTERFEPPQQIEEGFLLLKNHVHWVTKNDPRGYAVMRRCMNALLFRQPNATWLRDFHAIWSQWDDNFVDICESAVEAFYAASPKNKNGYTQIAHGILFALRLNDDAEELLPKAKELIQKDKDLGRYDRVTPHEEVLALAFSGNLEQAEALLAGAYSDHKQAFDGYKVLGQWARAYGTRDQALTYYQKEKSEGRRSQECAIQHALIRSEQEPLEEAAKELDTCNLKALGSEAAFTELSKRYMRTRFVSMSIGMSHVNEFASEKENWSYIADRLETPETCEGKSIASLAKGLLHGASEGNNAFNEHNAHPMQNYYCAIMHAALGNWNAARAKLSETEAEISPDFPIQIWSASQYLLSSKEACKQHEDSILGCIQVLEDSLKKSPERTASQYALLAKLYLYAGNKDAALRVIESVRVIGSPGWQEQFSSIFTWMGYPQEGAKLLEKKTPQDFYQNHSLFLKTLSHALLGDKESAQEMLKSLRLQSPNYLKEQSAFRQNVPFCEMVIAEILEDNAWKKEAEQRSRDCDPFFAEKLKTWNVIKEKQLTPA